MKHRVNPVYFFFFSSRRRHTRCGRDWSSDVCSSDLLVHNAVDAALETKGSVTIRWREAGDCVEVIVRDEGEGIMNPANLFVPFFTIKLVVFGIVLTLIRKIA